MSTNSSYYLTFSDPFSSHDPLVSRKLFLLRNVQVLELLLALFAFIAIHSLRQKKHYGLPVWPFLGMLPSLAFGLRGNIYEWLTDILSRQNGTFHFRGPCFSSLNSTITCDPRNVEHLLKNRFSAFPKGSYFRDNLRDLLGDGIFNADDETWQRQRKTASIEFHSAKFRQLTTHSLYELVHKRLLPVLEASKMLKESIKGVDDFADEFIRTRKKEMSLEGESTKRSDLLTVFMGLRDEKGGSFSDKFLRDICVNFILAGRDTSSVALSWFFWLLEMNPEVEEKIMVEMCKILRQRDDNGKGAKVDYEPVFGPEEIKKMNYLQAALSEALRLYPSVPVDHKEVQEDDVFPDGTILKKGEKVIYAIYAMGRMEAIWGKDCREFRPERWLRDGRFMSESAYKFTAFNGGPRLCLGKDFAYYQMKYVAAAIVYRHKVKAVEGHKVEPKLALTMYMKHGLLVNLINRSVSEIDQYYAKTIDDGSSV
ncbi:BnaC02g41740D [Brassica napus]|uniref:BnaC02g41740D protein n=1 Tax=Brassica napus TaxID=3708 RepID=A0A078HQB8_BRANA|nr:BnaC02g41740D [Brassica napus]